MNPEVAVSIVLPDWFDPSERKCNAVIYIEGQDFQDYRGDFRILHGDSTDCRIHVDGSALVNADHGRNQQAAF